MKNKSVKQITIKESNLYFCGIPASCVDFQRVRGTPYGVQA
ncbi:hypothetical protein ECARS42123_4063 [Escherichia coli ARS4.2123]|nr:hypothetical protein ECARS42123_4063 [Escherichia coli ARS4.2123]